MQGYSPCLSSAFRRAGLGSAVGVSEPWGRQAPLHLAGWSQGLEGLRAW